MNEGIASKPLIRVAVRDLADFVHRTGDLAGSGRLASPARALEGTRGHQKIQTSRPAGYRAEVPVRHDIDREAFTLRISGRIDGLQLQGDRLLIEEIKTVSQADTARLPDPLHWAQGRLYAFLLGRETECAAVTVRLTYFHLDDEEVEIYTEQFPWDEVAQFFEATVDTYLGWIDAYVARTTARDRSIEALPFPFADYREGQHRLAATVYKQLAAGKHLFLEAPTGIGKTLGVLFGALKSLPHTPWQKILYLTAKTLGRGIVEETLDQLRRAGLHCHAVTLTARERICQKDGRPCDPTTCPFTRGYYDRRHAALEEALEAEALTRERLVTVGERHQVCPFALGMDASFWVDLILCDYNYLFDPKGGLRGTLTETGRNTVLLVDEAHNLVDRARENFSAELSLAMIDEVRQTLAKAAPGCRRALTQLKQGLVRLRDFPPKNAEALASLGISARGWHMAALPRPLLASLRQFLQEAEAWLVRSTASEHREALLNLYYQALQWSRIAECFDVHYVTLLKQNRSDTKIRLLCLNPAPEIERTLGASSPSIFFSATLSPTDYYRNLLTPNHAHTHLCLASPFPRRHLQVVIADQIATHYRARASSYDQVAHAIAAMARPKPGNYLAFFPSYEYLRQVLNRFQHFYPDFPIQIQQPGMSDADRTAFLAQFHRKAAEGLIGFVVMGGIFGEAIDLVGEQLVGAAIVGVGIPQIETERELLREHFSATGLDGFLYAYTYPGWNRVLQAAGRVIRSETDRGGLLLIDQRYRRPLYQSLLPPWWDPIYASDPDAIQSVFSRFWSDGQDADA